ncbi:hypothetical protein SCOR_33410 [Sulfidibacter corallicola]|uniref:Uncharacterized protein n=1 Tax=Sulfidibacter corallicola TaxID=2818388 RepID=A0A8A4TI20_SULCO|nr:hypothetical protein [Sulfidibacter corallicola]QTD49566.1 hypothetical protein J3U87_28600 [Sulfidibacter corallicola]
MSEETREQETVATPPAAPKHGGFDPGLIRKLWIALGVACALPVIAELFVDRHHGHGEHFPVDWGFGFYAVLGFLACAGSILLAKGLGLFLKKNEDYYDHDEPS